MTEEELPEPPISLVGIVLSPRFQILAGPLASGSCVFGFLLFQLAALAGVPRPELIALLGLGFGVSIASIAVVLGVVLLVAKQTPHRGWAGASIALGALAFVLAGPLFLLVVAGAGGHP